MKCLLLAFALAWGWTACCDAQSITINLGGSPAGVCGHFAVGPADKRYAPTFEDIAHANEALAKKGNTEAAFELGLAYMQGLGVKQDLTLAEHWFEIGAMSPGDKSLVGGMYLSGECFPKDFEIAARWFAAAGNRPGDLFELAQAYRQATPPQTERATKMYVALLQQTGHPEVRRAQMELGNFVLDGKYTAGDDANGRAQNLEWARIIAQELLGQEEYKIAIDYDIGREDLPKDRSMWLRFCKRAAAYNVDLAQHFLAQAIMDGMAPNLSGYADVAWIRLASDKQTGEIAQLHAMESSMTPQQEDAADHAYKSLVEARVRDGAYYSPDDPLRGVTSAKLAAMPKDDPDVQLRRAFALEKAAQTSDDAYREAMALYRTVRDRREMDVRFVLGRNYLNGTNGVPRNLALARYWLNEAAGRGSQPARALLANLSGASTN